MGRKKKGFNWKARQNPSTEVDVRKTPKIQVDLPAGKEKYDESNQLLLPSKKRPTKKVKGAAPVGRILSKTQRKKLEKIVEKKKKKGDRQSVLDALADVQVPATELNQLTSLAAMQTKGLKRHFIELESNGFEITAAAESHESPSISSISGSKRRKRILAALLQKSKSENVNDPNVVGFENSSSDSDENEESFDVPIITNHIKSEECSDDETEEAQDLKNSVVPENTKTVESTGITDAPEEEKNPSKHVIPEKVKENGNKSESNCESNLKKEIVPAVFVPVFRKPEIQEARLKLPILAEEQSVMEVINENRIIIVAGETGSGKTTQIPQFLYEAGYAREKEIGITQPRRVAAISMSKRVAEEMNLSTDEVSYLIRFEGNVTPKTKIKFMTDGVLLKEIQSDFILSKYSVIILDEAHERSIYTDILVGLLSRIVPLRNKRSDPLKLIVMSATLRVEDFTENSRLFKVPPPVIKVESRQFPVSVHFNKKTSDDYLKECFHKTSKIHTQLPDGGILIFVTGQQEVKWLVRKLRRAFPLKANGVDSGENNELKESLEIVKKSRRKSGNVKLPDVNLDKYSVVPTDDTEVDILAADEEISDQELDEPKGLMKTCSQPLWVLPLYSLLRSSEQAKVFQKPPNGSRLCVVATNVAETSLTIPNIKYVVDSGRTKTRLYDKMTGVSAYHVEWCSKASANQRAGRAGRTGPGHCYRLYSSAVFNDQFEQFAVPEIQRKPVDDLILQMKSMNIIKVYNFPFPTSPDLLQLKAAERRLTILGALEENSSSKDEYSRKLTQLGESMASFPVSPRYAKMLALSFQHDLLEYTICIVAALSVPEVLIENHGDKRWSQLRRAWAGVGNSLLLGDVMVLLRAVGAAEYEKSNLEEFCARIGLRHKAVVEIRKLRVQLTNQINLHIPELNLSVDPDLKPPTDSQLRLIRQIVLAGMADQVARKVNLDEVKDDEDKVKWKRAYRGCEMEEPIFMHSTSVLKSTMPEWVVYQEVYETNKLYMRGVTGIEPEWLPVFVPILCNLSEPLEKPPPRYDSESGRVYCHVNGTFGKAAFELPTMEIPYLNTSNSYRWFAAFLLNGDVFPKLKRFTRHLLLSPFSMTKSWAKLQQRTEIMLNALMSKDVNTRDQLLDAWKENSNYLLDAFKTWLPETAHADLIQIWPPLQ